jgi:hypothetical protein
MGALPARPPGPSWRIRYCGGGPLDGREDPTPDPETCPIVHLAGERHDGPFVGTHVYVRGAILPGARVVEMCYRGERWRGNIVA